MKQLKITTVLVMSAFAAFAPAQSSAVIGKLGQTLKEAPIYKSPNTRSDVFYTANPYEYLVVRPAKERGWMMVFMNNGVFAYVDKDHVAQLPYDIVTKPKEKKAVPVPERSTRIGGSSTSRGKAAEAGLQFQGTKYVWGGNDLQNGIDCSGFVKQLFGKVAGVNLPRTAAEQALVGKKITRLEDLRKGDRLYFWESKRNKIGHTGIYLGNGYFVHSSSGKGGVSTDYLGSKKWLNILVAARR